MIKMIVTSFYNTLINSEEAIPATTILEIERLRNKGIIFVIATNGTYQDVLDYNKDFPFLDYIISLNGSYIYDVSKEKVIYKKKITMSNLKKISQLTDNNIKYYTGEKYYSTYSLVENQDVYKVEIATEEIDKKSISKLDLNKSILKINNKKIIELTSSKVNMFTGVDQIALKNNISLSEILVIAGNESDYGLVKNIKNSYVIGNCDSSLKKLKRKITTSNNQKGVEKVLNQI